jgi:predicted transcriptional regulator
MPLMARIRGQYGPVAQALLQAADEQPGTVRELAQRANVGYAVARYSVSRLVSAGVCVLDGGRPAKVWPAAQHEQTSTGAMEALDALQACWLGRGSSTHEARPM